MNLPWERWRLAGAFLLSTRQLAGESPALPGLWSRRAIPKSRRLPRFGFSALWLLAGVAASLGQNNLVITVQPQDVTACPGSEATFHAEVNGPPPFQFQWFWNSAPVFTGVVSGPNHSTLTLRGVQPFDDRSPVFVLAMSPFGNAQSTNAFLYVPDPGICQQPTDTTAAPGGTFSFHVVAAGTEPLRYQWWYQAIDAPEPLPLLNSSRVTGADTPHLVVANASSTDTGAYWVAVTNAFEAGVTSRPALCSVGSPPTATNLLSRIVRVFTSTTFAPSYTGTLPQFYQWYRNDAPIAGATNSTLTLTNIQRPEVGLYHVAVTNGAGIATSERAHLQVRLTLEGDSPIYREEATDELVSLTNAIKLLFAPPPTVVFHGVPLLFSTYGATAAVGEASRCGWPASHSMWVLYASPRTETTRVSTEGSDFDTVLAVHTWDKNPNHAPTQLVCDDNSGYDSKDSLLFFSTTAGQNYYIAVDGAFGTTGTARLQVGENIRKPAYDRINGTYRFEWAGTFWYENRLISATNLGPVTNNWSAVLTIPPTNYDWIIGYTNPAAAADAARFYSTTVNTNSSLP